MKTHGQEPGQDVNVEDVWEGQAEQGSPAFLPPPRSKGISRRVTWISTAIVIVLIGMSAGVFAFLYHQQGQNAASGNFWNQVLNNYQISELVAAPGQPDTLYACALPTKAHNPAGGVTQAPGMQAYTLLRSSDAGLHWQDLGKQAGLGSMCEVVVSSTNANELYVLSTPSISLPGSTAPFFKHSLDGGQSWKALSPKMAASNAAWSVSQISLVGNQLFGLQAISQGSVPPQVPRGTTLQPAFKLGLTRLVKSTDGGQTWSAVDTQFAGKNLSVRQFRVDPSNARTIYILEGGAGFPRIVPQIPHVSGITGTELYKSINGGANWTLLQKNLPYSTQLQLASAKPNMLFLGETFGPMPLATTEGSDTHALPSVGKSQAMGHRSFTLHMSSDGGTNWKDITPVKDEGISSSWMVSSDGSVYRYTQSFSLSTIQGGGNTSGSSSGSPGQINPGGQPVGGTPLPQPTVTPQMKNGVPYIPANGTPAEPVITSPPAPQPTGSTVPQTPQTPQNPQVPQPGDGSLQVYNPAGGGWHELAKGPDTLTGWLLAITPDGQQGSQQLWLMGTYTQGDALYRATMS